MSETKVRTAWCLVVGVAQAISNAIVGPYAQNLERGELVIDLEKDIDVEGMSRIEVVDQKTAAEVLAKAQAEFKRIATYTNDLRRKQKLADEQTVALTAELKAAKEREDKMVERLNNVQRSAPEWKLEDGSLQHVARRLRAPKGVDQTYFNATVLTPEEMRYMGDLGDAERAVLDPFNRHWARRLKVTEGLRFLVEELHALNDTIRFADIALAGRKEQTPYGQSGPYAQRIKQLPWYPDYHKVSNEVARAMHGQTASPGQGVDWVPYFMSANLKLAIVLFQQVPALFEEIVMPTPKYDNPVEGADPTLYLIGEATSDTESTNVITASTPKTTKMTLSAVKLAMRILLSSEILEDSIINVASDTLRRIAKVFGRGFEDIVLNGDTAATHQDSDVTSAQDRRKAWNGLRKHSLITNMPKQDLATFNTANLLAMRKAMGIYGSRPSELAWIVGYSGMIKMMQIAEVITMEKYGVQATVLAGEVAKFFGSPVILSEFQREDLNASGVYDGTTTTKGSLQLVNRDCFARGERRTITINSSDDRHIETDQTVVVGTWRGDFQPWYTTTSAANKIVALGYNF